MPNNWCRRGSSASPCRCEQWETLSRDNSKTPYPDQRRGTKIDHRRSPATRNRPSARPYSVDGLLEEVDDSRLAGPDRVPLDTWRENFPYDELMARAEYEPIKRQLQIELLTALEEHDQPLPRFANPIPNSLRVYLGLNSPLRLENRCYRAGVFLVLCRLSSGCHQNLRTWSTHTGT
jgi:hypothetical protein